MAVINYIFYRLYIHYRKRDNTVYTAVMYISMLEIFAFFFVFMMYNSIFCNTRNLFKELLDYYDIDHTGMKLFAISFCIVLALTNYFFYRNKVKKYEMKYISHPMNKRFKLWMLYFVVLFLIFIPILIFKFRQ